MQTFEERHAAREPKFGHRSHRGLKHYILYFLENENLQAA